MSKHHIIILIISLTFSACSSLKQWEYLPTSQEDEQHLYLVSHGWHSGLVIPATYLDHRFDFLTSYFGRSQYYEFGWGDEDFYPARKNTFLLGLKALFWPTSTLMHVVAVPVKPQNYFTSAETVEIKVSTKAMKHLLNYLSASFKRDTHHEPISKQKGIYGRSFFFKAQGYFFMTRTCNTWTTQALEEAGLPVNSFFTLTASSLVDQTKDALKRYPKTP